MVSPSFARSHGSASSRRGGRSGGRSGDGVGTESPTWQVLHLTITPSAQARQHQSHHVPGIYAQPAFCARISAWIPEGTRIAPGTRSERSSACTSGTGRFASVAPLPCCRGRRCTPAESVRAPEARNATGPGVNCARRRGDHSWTAPCRRWNVPLVTWRWQPVLRGVQATF
jgi:hypothetical protein